jgi:hypothetical protein
MDCVESVIHCFTPIIYMGTCLFGKALLSNGCLYLLIKNLLLATNSVSLFVSRSLPNNGSTHYSIIDFLYRYFRVLQSCGRIWILTSVMGIAIIIIRHCIMLPNTAWNTCSGQYAMSLSERLVVHSLYEHYVALCPSYQVYLICTMFSFL